MKFSDKDIVYSKISAYEPKNICKSYTLTEDGELQKTPGGNIRSGKVEIQPIQNISEMKPVVMGLEANQALIYGRPRYSEATVTTAENLDVIKKRLNKENVIARTKEHFGFFTGNSLFPIDYDPGSGQKPLTRDELRDILYSVCPPLRTTPHIIFDTSSGNVYNGDKQLIGPKGKRVLFVIKSGTDIPRAGETLFKRLLLAGKGFIEISKSGSLLVRTIVDGAVWSPERLDFAAGASCKPPLEQRRSEPQVISPDGEPLDSQRELPSLTLKEDAEVEKLIADEKVSVRPEAERVRDAYVEERVQETLKTIPAKKRKEAEPKIRKTYAAAARDQILGPEFLLKRAKGKPIAIKKLLADPEKYHDTCYFDPLEPDYSNNPRIARVNLKATRPYIFSFAHGGIRYFIGRTEPSKEAVKLAKEIETCIAKELGLDAKPDVVNPIVIDRMITGAFYSGQKSKLFLLTRSGNLVQFSSKESYRFLAKRFGKAVDTKKLLGLLNSLNIGKEKDRKKLIESSSKIHKDAIMDHIKFSNQRDAIEWRVNMFIQQNMMQFKEDSVRLILAHKPFADMGDWDPEIIADFKEHFSRFDEFLKFITMSRFVLDRKKSYLWLKADSDWGKGFLLGILHEMDCSVSTSMKEIEKMLEGAPSGLSPKDFKRSIVLVIDEFKTVKSELKQLQSEITLSPKNQLACSVEVFAKLFLSAESVNSLVSENGVEDQFANRMSIFEETGSLTKRPLYIKNNSLYFNNVLAYAVRQINLQILNMQSRGRAMAELTAEKWLNDFIRRYGLDTKYDRLSANLPGLAKDIAAYWCEFPDEFLTITEKGVFVEATGKHMETYLERHYDRSQIPSLRMKKDLLLKQISDDGKGAGTKRFYKGVAKTKRGIRLKNEGIAKRLHKAYMDRQEELKKASQRP